MTKQLNELTAECSGSRAYNEILEKKINSESGGLGGTEEIENLKKINKSLTITTKDYYEALVTDRASLETYKEENKKLNDIACIVIETQSYSKKVEDELDKLKKNYADTLNTQAFRIKELEVKLKN